MMRFNKSNQKLKEKIQKYIKHQGIVKSLNNIMIRLNEKLTSYNKISSIHKMLKRNNKQLSTS